MTPSAGARLSSMVKVRIDDTELERRNSVRYLGVEIDKELTSKAHI